jgi:hypothetical protein
MDGESSGGSMDSLSSMNGGREKSEFRARQYPLDISGPFVVYVKPKNVTDKFEIIKITKMIYEKNFLDVNVRQLNSKKIRVTCSTAIDANILIKDKKLAGLNVYAPAVNVETQGVIYLTEDVADFDEFVEDGYGVIEKLNKKIKLIACDRIHKKIEGKLVPTKFIKLIFEGKLLPDYFVIYGLRVKVNPRHPKVFYCDRCLRFGHTIKYCFSKPKCEKCNDAHLTKDCTGISRTPATPESCKVCKKNHDDEKTIEFCTKVRREKAKVANKQSNVRKATFAEMLAALNPNDCDVNEVSNINNSIYDNNDESESIPQKSKKYKKRKRIEDDLVNSVRSDDHHFGGNNSSLNSSNINNDNNRDDNIPTKKNLSFFRQPVLEFLRDYGLPQLFVDLVDKYLLPLIDKFISDVLFRLLGSTSSSHE